MSALKKDSGEFEIMLSICLFFIFVMPKMAWTFYVESVCAKGRGALSPNSPVTTYHRLKSQLTAYNFEDTGNANLRTYLG